MAEDEIFVDAPKYTGPERRRFFRCPCHPKHTKAIEVLEKWREVVDIRLPTYIPWKIFIPIMAPLMLLFVMAAWGIFDRVSAISADVAVLKSEQDNNRDKLKEIHEDIERNLREFRKANGGGAYDRGP